MKSLGALAVAERDIRALRTARADSRLLRRLHKREPASPFQSARTATATAPAQHRNGPHASPADSLATLAHPSHGYVARMKTRDSARHRIEPLTYSLF